MGKKLAANVNLDGVLYAAGSEPPKDIAEQITNPNAWESSDNPAPEPEATPYDDLKGPELKAEIARRNDGRDEDAQVKPDGKSNAAMVAALVADDAANPGA